MVSLWTFQWLPNSCRASFRGLMTIPFIIRTFPGRMDTYKISGRKEVIPSTKMSSFKLANHLCKDPSSVLFDVPS
ncbi:hypothetical protein BDV28DRAFT_141042 [Aspergillus coremiiformis]|uniref:Uncharacterized protein n=1 Tax=Aspergillus coremiiformis TaxID=138285 RepID=A0A5N6YY08_9EURO|nr:hypothetical protein BDV28DRAFT_141042 [Aspergillus coremiiformis]